MTKTIGVVGGGPKAVAMAAWIDVWNQVAKDFDDAPVAPRVVVFEACSSVAAAWSGEAGYSDGTPALCTPAEHDLVWGVGARFPCSNVDLRGRFMSLMSERYSWRRLCPPGSSPPTHLDFSEYLKAAAARAGASSGVEIKLNAKVRRITEIMDDGWSVEYGENEELVVNALVVTGPGPSAREIPGQSSLEDACLAERYWAYPKRKDKMEALLRPDEEHSPQVVIVGAGGAAAAIALDLCEINAGLVAGKREHEDEFTALAITFVAPQATLFTRGESSWERDVLTDPKVWGRLSGRQRAEVGDQLISGVVFGRVLANLEKFASRNEVVFEFEPGYVRFLEGKGNASPLLPALERPVRAIVELGRGGLVALDADLLVNAAGFNPLGFTELFSDPLLKNVILSLGRGGVADALDDSLALKLECEAMGETVRLAKNLHLPMFAGGSAPPGLASLLALGEVAERILVPHLSE